MINLETSFTKKKAQYTQVYCSPILYIYRVDNPRASLLPYWEVFKVVIKQPDIFHDDEYVSYPGDERFGVNAWACSTLGSVRKVLAKHFADDTLNTVSDDALSEILTK